MKALKLHSLITRGILTRNPRNIVRQLLIMVLALVASTSWIALPGYSVSGEQRAIGNRRWPAPAPSSLDSNQDKTILFFLRHTEPQTRLVSTGTGTFAEDCNPSRSCCTMTLNPLGLERRNAIAKWFADQGRAQTLTHLITTNKVRAVQTLETLANLSGLAGARDLYIDRMPGDGIQQHPPTAEECSPGFETTTDSKQAIVNAIRALPLGSRAVIANHSETLYSVISEATGIDTSDPVDFPKQPGTTNRVNGFNNLWIVEVDSSGAGRLLRHLTLDFKLKASGRIP